MQENNQEREIDLMVLFQVLKQRIVWLLLGTILCGALAWIGTTVLITPKYTATVTMYVYSDAGRGAEGSSSITSSEISASKALVDTYLVVLKSNTVIKALIDSLKLDTTVGQLADTITTGAINNTEVFSVSVTHEDPVMAQRIANTLAEIAPAEIVRVVKAGGVEIVDPAELPLHPSSPNPPRNTALAAVLGFILMYGIFCLREIFNTTIRTADDLLGRYDIPVLGSIPKFEIATQPREGGV